MQPYDADRTNVPPDEVKPAKGRNRQRAKAAVEEGMADVVPSPRLTACGDNPGGFPCAYCAAQEEYAKLDAMWECAPQFDPGFWWLIHPSGTILLLHRAGLGWDGEAQRDWWTVYAYHKGFLWELTAPANEPDAFDFNEAKDAALTASGLFAYPEWIEMGRDDHG